MRMSVPARPSLGVLFGTALAAWLAVTAAEALSWQLFVDGCTLRQVLLAAGAAAALALLAACVARGVRRRRRVAGVKRYARPASSLRQAQPAATAQAAPAVSPLSAGEPQVASDAGGSPRPAAPAAPARTGAAWRGAAVLALAFAVAFACALLYWHAWEEDRAAFQEALGSEGVVCELAGDAATRDYGQVSIATTVVDGRNVSLRILWPDDAEPLSAGHAVLVRGSFSAANTEEGGRWNHRQGHVGMLAASTVEDAGYAGGLRGLVAPFRDASFSRISQLESECSGLLAGILLGNRTLYAGTELEQDFRTTGLAHLMAVSGTHLAVVTALLAWVLARLRVRKVPRCALTLGCLVLYVALTCFAASALRSLAMCATALCAGLVGRRSHVPSALALCVLVFVCANPNTAFTVGFQLSVLSVGGLVLFSPLVELWLAWALPQRLGELAGPIAATIAATLATLPVTVPMFSQLPVVSPLSTLLASPLITLALGLGIPALLLYAPVPVLGSALLGAAGTVAKATAALVHVLADLPGACLPVQGSGMLLAVLFAAGLVALWLAWPVPPQAASAHERPGPGAARARGVALACCMVAPLAVVLVASFGGVGATVTALDTQAQSDAQVIMLDVGQGDCTLIRCGDAAVLIDTGEDEQLLLEGLARNGVTHLDAVFLTHKDSDHCGALAALTGVVGVEHVYMHEGLLGTEYVQEVEEDVRWVTDGGQLEGIAPGSVTQVGSFTLTLVGPQDAGEGENEDSLIQVLEYDEDGDGQPEARALFTGDAEAEALAPVLDEVGDVDVLKVAHHGSRGAESAEQLAVLTPAVALIGVGADNSYGHPTEEMLELLAACGAKVYRTDEDGDIALSFSGTAIGVSTQK